MGATQSKGSGGNQIDAANILDILATKYILTQNFTDMQKLSNPDYCNKLVILTSDIIKKFLKEREIEYLSQRIKDGVPISVKKKSSIIYLSTQKLKKKAGKKKKEDDEEDESDNQEEWEEKVYNADGSYRIVKRRGYRGLSSATSFKKSYDEALLKEKSLLSELDVENKYEKDSMCKSIAKFYIKIAHLFAAIHKVVNPIYKFGTSEYSLMNKLKIPKGAKVTLSEKNLCSRRIKTMKAEETSEGKIKVSVNNCRLNKKTKEKSVDDDVLDNISLNIGDKIESQKLLGEEVGIPQLDKLYLDVYNFKKGKFTTKSPTSKMEYMKDLETFYKVFTGKKDYKKWNKSKKMSFKDVPLVAYHETEMCKDDGSAWNKSYEGDKDNKLFVKFAKNIKDMLKKTDNNQQKMLEILDEIFVWIEPPSGLKMEEDKSIRSKLVTINPKLNDKKLQDIVVKTRKLIIAVYLQCEKDYKQGLMIFKAIAGEKLLKQSIAKKEQLDLKMESLAIGSSKDLGDMVTENIEKSLESSSKLETSVASEAASTPMTIGNLTGMIGAGKSRRRRKKKTKTKTKKRRA
jgi:hypothetical protein